jgi:hypothetical protein
MWPALRFTALALVGMTALWVTLSAANAGSPQSEGARFEQSQRALLQAEVARLAPRKNAAAIYAIGIAGWADQDVFTKELDGGLAAIGGILPIQGRTLRLVNHRETQASIPLANERNFAAAVHAVGAAMNKNEDILLLFMTSHGTPRGFALRLPSEVTTELTPQQVAGTLDKEGIKNRIVVVSACFSGIFVPALANDDTIVLTAADAKSTSFGCAPERDWTYFGYAFFKHSLRPGTDFRRAFDNARVLIQGWELMDHGAAVKPAGPFRAGAGRQTAAAFSGRAVHRALGRGPKAPSRCCGAATDIGAIGTAIFCPCMNLSPAAATNGYWT